MVQNDHSPLTQNLQWLSCHSLSHSGHIVPPDVLFVYGFASTTRGESKGSRNSIGLDSYSSPSVPIERPAHVSKYLLSGYKLISNSSSYWTTLSLTLTASQKVGVMSSIWKRQSKMNGLWNQRGLKPGFNSKYPRQVT